MDDPELEVLVDGGRAGLATDEVAVRQDSEREPGPPEGRERVEERWAEYLADARARGRDLFNGGVTYLRRAVSEAGGLVLEVGRTDYRQFVVTTLRDRPWFAAHAPGAIREALGNSVLLVRGGEALLGKRSPRVSAYAGRAHLIGGVLDVLQTPDVAGIVEHLRLELREEAGVEPRELVGQPRLLAVMRDLVLRQPELAWVWETSGDLRQIGRQLAAHEHSDFEIVPRTGIGAPVWQNMTPVARESWRRWAGQP